MFGTLTPKAARIPRTLSLLRDWEPFEMMERLFNEEDGWMFEKGFAPPMNVAETKDVYEVTLELPGLKPEDVKVELLEGRLYISGEKKEEVEEKGKTFHRIERRHGEFRRVLPLPTNIATDKVEAKFDHGLLKVTIAKTEEAKPKAIEVHAT